MSAIEQHKIKSDENGMRLDRWFKNHFPGIGFGALQKLLRSGQVRIDGKRVKHDTRVNAGQLIRIPPLLNNDVHKNAQIVTLKSVKNASDADALSAMMLYEDDKVFVFNKPAGLAVQGGSGVTRHIDKMLESLTNKRGEKPRLVHRLDRDTSGVLVVARSRSAAQKLTDAFRKRDTKKVYWALVQGTPQRNQGRLSTWLLKEPTPDGDRMRVVKHGVPNADHAISTYRVIEKAGQRLTWVELQPETGRTHQLRVHMLHLKCPIIGDPKYFIDDPNIDFPGGIQKRLHLHARRIIIPHPSGGTIDVTASLPTHMQQSWNLLGLQEDNLDQIDL